MAFLILSVVSMSCGNNGQNSKSDSQVSKAEVQTIDGTYSAKDRSGEIIITITGNSWTGKTIMRSGVGSDYDNENAQYDNGIIKGNDLYESSGMVKVGYVNGNSLTTSAGSNVVTLHKN